jgi:SHS2 domain-containing protein
MRLPFRILEHTADVGFEAFGSTRREVFENAARALLHLIVDPATIEPSEKIPIEVTGADPPNLLVNWLSEILFLYDAERWLFRDFKLNSLDEHSASGWGWGEQYDRVRHQTNLQIKAITYHQLRIEEYHRGWRAQVYVDI